MYGIDSAPVTTLTEASYHLLVAVPLEQDSLVYLILLQHCFKHCQLRKGEFCEN